MDKNLSAPHNWDVIIESTNVAMLLDPAIKIAIIKIL